MNESKQQPNVFQRIAFYLSGCFGCSFLVRNTFRIRSYCRSYKQLQLLLSKNNDMTAQMNQIKSSKHAQLVILETVFPNFPSKYFKPTLDKNMFNSDLCKFYQGLICQTGFQGNFRDNGIDFPIYFNMNKPTVGFDISHAALSFESKGLKFHRNQIITVLGQLEYSNNKKQWLMNTKMLALDRIQMTKFWQMKILATIFSSFYFSILLGFAISLFKNKQMIQKQVIEDLKKYISRKKDELFS